MKQKISTNLSSLVKRRDYGGNNDGRVNEGDNMRQEQHFLPCARGGWWQRRSIDNVKIVASPRRQKWRDKRCLMVGVMW